jgi:predicted transcriptional regulator
MSKQLNIRLPDSISEEIQEIANRKSISVSKFMAESIALALAVEKNMSSEKQSRLVIENAKDAPENYKLLLKSA